MSGFSAAGMAAEALAGADADRRTPPRIEETTNSRRRDCADERVSGVCDGMWVPWEAEVANASPECLQVIAVQQRVETTGSLSPHR